MMDNNGKFFKKPVSDWGIIPEEFPKSENKEMEKGSSLIFSKPKSFEKNKTEDENTAVNKNDYLNDVNTVYRMDNSVVSQINDTVELFRKLDLEKYADEMSSLLTSVTKDRFTVAVVGEFSKGKSTFINRLVGKDVLPTGNTPTTAMLTRIMYNKNNALVISDGKGFRKSFPLSQKSWSGYTASLDKNDPKGVAFVGLSDTWLENGIEIIDTPGAGDLEEGRVALIGDALKSSDGAIITISAEVAMSMSEKTFIEERLISKKMPFLMLIVTKLDRIDENQRSGILKFIKQKLTVWGFDIPVFVPCDISVPGGEYDDIIGMDKVKSQIDSWVVDPKRVSLTCEWMIERVKAILASCISELCEKNVLYEADSKKRDELITKKKALLKKASDEWEELRMTMMERSEETYKKIASKARDFEQTLFEKLTHEMSHSPNPQKWWTEDYPYRLKVEMSNFSASIDNIVSRRISDDARWFNQRLDKSFKTNVLFSSDNYDSDSQDLATDVNSTVNIKSINTARNVTKIGISALSIVGFMACASVGLPAILGTVGVNTGGSMITETLFKKKIEGQKQTLKEELSKSIPESIRKSMVHSESRLKNMYNDIIKEAQRLEKSWMSTQSEAIDTSIEKNENYKSFEITDKINQLESMLKRWDF